MPEIQLAAGVVLIRRKSGHPQVAVIHRPEFDDWTLPKGKPISDEVLPATAIRETLEETGYQTILDFPLGITEHPVGSSIKRTHWWRGQLVDDSQARLDSEVDKVEWLSPKKAIARLDYEDDRQLIEDALAAPRTTPLLFVRHAKAMTRKNWTGLDSDRRLDERGRRQAQRLVDLLESFGVEQLVSSASTRCVDTLQPYARQKNLKIRKEPALMEEAAVVNKEGVAEALQGFTKTAARGIRVAICGHRPVFPLMFRAMDWEDNFLKPAEVFIAYIGRDGKTLATERFVQRF